MTIKKLTGCLIDYLIKEFSTNNFINLYFDIFLLRIKINLFVKMCSTEVSKIYRKSSINYFKILIVVLTQIMVQEKTNKIVEKLF